jgi:hypothetical protein
MQSIPVAGEMRLDGRGRSSDFRYRTFCGVHACVACRVHRNLAFCHSAPRYPSSASCGSSGCWRRRSGRHAVRQIRKQRWPSLVDLLHGTRARYACRAPGNLCLFWQGVGPVFGACLFIVPDNPCSLFVPVGLARVHAFYSGAVAAGTLRQCLGKHLTIHPSRIRFAGRIDSGDRPHRDFRLVGPSLLGCSLREINGSRASTALQN